MADFTKGKSELAGSYTATCPNCRRHGMFKAEHYQHHESPLQDRY